MLFFANKKNMDVKKRMSQDIDDLLKLKYTNGKIAVVDEFTDINTGSTVQVDGVFVVLCLSGRCTCDVNGSPYVIRKNEALIYTPNSVIENVLFSTDLQFRCVFITAEYAENTLPMPAVGWNFRLFAQDNPVISLLDREVEGFCRYCDVFKEKFNDTTNIYRDKIIDALMQAFIYDFGNILYRLVGLNPRPLSSAENIFDNFISLLAQSYPKHRNVAYYADRLNITPKYLSVVCKKTGGKTASKIIDAYVTKDIERLLMSTRKSVKEISNELDFPNASFFGRYVKKNLGCAPNELRHRRCRTDEAGGRS